MQSDGAAGGAVFSPDLKSPFWGVWVDRLLFDHSSSTVCELYATIDAVSFICQRGVIAASICDSKPALQSLSAVQSTHLLIVRQILSFLTLMSARYLFVKFISIPSHIGLRHNATADRLAKEACGLPHPFHRLPLSLSCYLSKVRSAVLLCVQGRRDAERPFHVISHYESVCRHKYT